MRRQIPRVLGLVSSFLMGTSLGSVPYHTPVASAGVVPKSESASLTLVQDGTGFDGGTRTFLQGTNGFEPGDNSPNDGVVALGDSVIYKSSLQFRAGPAREVRVSMGSEGGIQFSFPDLSSWCHDGTAVTAIPSGGACLYRVPEGATESFDITFAASPTSEYFSGTSTEITPYLQVGSVKVNGDPLTVVGSPLIDLKASNSFSTYYDDSGFATGNLWVNLDKATLPEGYNDYGSYTPYNPVVEVDVSSFPEGILFETRSGQVTQSGGILRLEGVRDTQSVAYKIPVSALPSSSSEQRTISYQYSVRLVPDRYSPNFGDGSEPGGGEGPDYPTNPPGRAVPNNNYGSVTITNLGVTPSDESDFGWTRTDTHIILPALNNTVWDEGSKTFSSGEGTRAAADPNQAYPHIVAAGTQLRVLVHADVYLETAPSSGNIVSTVPLPAGFRFDRVESSKSSLTWEVEGSTLTVTLPLAQVHTQDISYEIVGTVEGPGEVAFHTNTSVSMDELSHQSSDMDWVTVQDPQPATSSATLTARSEQNPGANNNSIPITDTVRWISGVTLTSPRTVSSRVTARVNLPQGLTDFKLVGDSSKFWSVSQSGSAYILTSNEPVTIADSSQVPLEFTTRFKVDTPPLSTVSVVFSAPGTDVPDKMASYSVGVVQTAYQSSHITAATAPGEVVSYGTPVVWNFDIYTQGGHDVGSQAVTMVKLPNSGDSYSSWYGGGRGFENNTTPYTGRVTGYLDNPATLAQPVTIDGDWSTGVTVEYTTDNVQSSDDTSQYTWTSYESAKASGKPITAVRLAAPFIDAGSNRMSARGSLKVNIPATNRTSAYKDNFSAFLGRTYYSDSTTSPQPWPSNVEVGWSTLNPVVFWDLDQSGGAYAYPDQYIKVKTTLYKTTDNVDELVGDLVADPTNGARYTNLPAGRYKLVVHSREGDQTDETGVATVSHNNFTGQDEPIRVTSLTGSTAYEDRVAYVDIQPGVDAVSYTGFAKTTPDVKLSTSLSDKSCTDYDCTVSWDTTISNDGGTTLTKGSPVLTRLTDNQTVLQATWTNTATEPLLAGTFDKRVWAGAVGDYHFGNIFHVYTAQDGTLVNFITNNSNNTSGRRFTYLHYLDDGSVGVPVIGSEPLATGFKVVDGLLLGPDNTVWEVHAPSAPQNYTASDIKIVRNSTRPYLYPCVGTCSQPTAVAPDGVPFNGDLHGTPDNLFLDGYGDASVTLPFNADQFDHVEVFKMYESVSTTAGTPYGVVFSKDGRGWYSETTNPLEWQEVPALSTRTFHTKDGSSDVTLPVDSWVSDRVFKSGDKLCYAYPNKVLGDFHTGLASCIPTNVFATYSRYTPSSLDDIQDAFYYEGTYSWDTAWYVKIASLGGKWFLADFYAPLSFSSLRDSSFSVDPTSPLDEPKRATSNGTFSGKSFRLGGVDTDDSNALTYTNEGNQDGVSLYHTLLPVDVKPGQKIVIRYTTRISRPLSDDGDKITGVQSWFAGEPGYQDVPASVSASRTRPTVPVFNHVSDGGATKGNDTCNTSRDGSDLEDLCDSAGLTLLALPSDTPPQPEYTIKTNLWYDANNNQLNDDGGVFPEVDPTSFSAVLIDSNGWVVSRRPLDADWTVTFTVGTPGTFTLGFQLGAFEVPGSVSATVDENHPLVSHQASFRPRPNSPMLPHTGLQGLLLALLVGAGVLLFSVLLTFSKRR